MILNMGGGGIVPEENLGATTIIPRATDQVIPAKTYLREPLTIAGDADLVPANIKSGVNIFDVTGTMPDELVKIDGIKVNEPLNLQSIHVDYSASILPYDFTSGGAVVYNGEIHIIGSHYNDHDSKPHYKWNGKSWTSVSTLPYRLVRGSVVVLNGEIHILGGAGNIYYEENDALRHYKWNGKSWTSVSTLPYKFNDGFAVALNGEIHIMGGTTYKTDTDGMRHYKWNGKSWTSVSTLPYTSSGSAVALNGKIHIFDCSSNYDKYHYKLNGTTWVLLEKLPYGCVGQAVALNGKIHILGNNYHYKLNGTTWVLVNELPYDFNNGQPVLLNGEIHILGYSSEENERRHFIIQSELLKKVV